jgi:hypothetical protein
MGLWMRQRMPETLPPLAQTPALTRPLPLFPAIVRHLREALGQWRLGLQVIALISFANVCFYQGFFYLVDVTTQRSGATFAANTIATLVQGIRLLLAPRQRCAVFSIAYALASALFAGTTPLVSSWLTALHADWAVPLYALPYGCAALIAIDASRHAGLR